MTRKQSYGATRVSGLDDLPLMGVSHSSEDQTFVFTRAALIQMVSEAGRFECDILPSPIPQREIAVFARRRKRGKTT